MNDKVLYTCLCPMYFFCETEIPWIWSWSIETGYDDIQLPCLQKHYHVKWWSSINIEEKSAQIKESIKKK